MAQHPELKLRAEADVTYEVAMLFFFSKSYKTYQAVSALWRDGFYEDAWTLTRTMFEIWAQAAYLRAKPKERACQFREHDPVRMYRAYRSLKRQGEKEPLAAAQAPAFEGREDFAEIESQYNLRHKTAGRNWFGNSVRALAACLGPRFETEYLSGYWWQSNVVHTATTAMQHFVANPGEATLLNCHPGDAEPQMDVKMAPKSATLYLISIVEEISDGLSIDLGADIRSAVSDLHAIDAHRGQTRS